MTIRFNQILSWRRTLLVIAGVFVLAYALSVLWFVSNAPDIGIQCAFSPVIQKVDDRYLVDSKSNFPEPGDTLLQVGNQRIKQVEKQLWAQVLLLRALIFVRDEPIENSEIVRLGPAGEKLVAVQFQTQKGEEIHTVWCRLGTLPPSELVPSVLWFFIKLGLFVIGALVFWKRPADPSASQFFLLCIITLGAYMGGYHWVRIATQPMLLMTFMVCGVLLPPVSLHFYLVFPRPKEFLQKYPWRTLSAIYGPSLLFLAALTVNYIYVRGLVGRGASELEIAEAWSVLQSAIKIYLGLAALWYIASVICLVHSYQRAGAGTERNQVKWILYGAGLALIPIGYTLYLVTWVPNDFGSGAATWPMFAASVCFTAAFAVSITRYRLMQLDQIVSSGAVYFLLSSLAGLVYYAVVLAGMFAADLVGSHVIPGPSFTQTVWVSASFLVLILLLDLIRSRFKKVLDRRFYRDKYQLDRTLKRMGQAIEQLVDPPTLARRLLQASAELLNVSRGAVYLREGDPPIFRLAGTLGPTPPLTELSSGCPLVEVLKTRGALMLRPAGETPLGPAPRQLHLLGGEVAHALAHEGQLLALLVLGPKDMGAYGPDDLNLLSAFAQLTALALESAEGRHTIEGLNRDLHAKVEKISEQQRRILALQSQLMRQTARDPSKEADNTHAPGTPSPTGPQPGQVLASGILGSSTPVRQLMDLVRKVSATQSAVLIRGESGTGKELFARALHDNSARARNSFVKVHCAALSPGLLESELFGHVKGAFTGAHRDKVGRFELANGGTLFLDEIGDISLEVQTKLLRVLQEKSFERVGSSDPVQVDVRIIAATHQNLEEFIQSGRFREDLYYRLKVIDIAVPPLRARREDVPELAQHFLNLFAQRSNKAVTHIEDDALLVLKSYRWPGNIRELENVMERAVVVAEGPAVTLQELPLEMVQASLEEASPRGDNGWPDDEPLQDRVPAGGIEGERAERDHRERERLVRALASAQGNKAEAARALGLARSTLVSRLKKYGLS